MPSKGPILVIVLLALLIIFLITSPSQTPKLAEMSFEELKVYFADLAKQKGAPYAFEVLKTSAVPPDTDMHLLGHVVGDELYAQMGAEGIKICTQDFRNACSHSIVVGQFSDKGEEALAEIAQACQKAPGGRGAYLMCYHGLGHGILAYTGYDFPQTINLCQKVGTQEHNFLEYPECVSGAVMEIISGGGHDRPLWSKQRAKYLKADHPTNICSPPLMPEEARGRCYDYLTPYLWEAIGADINKPTETDFKTSFTLCSQIAEAGYQNICYGGFGKEFVALSQDKDIRKVDQMDEKKLKKVVNWCNVAPHNQAVKECLDGALRSLFWGGENDVTVSLRFCHIISNPQNQQHCFLNLIDQVDFYIKDPKYRASFCQKLPVEFASQCQ